MAAIYDDWAIPPLTQTLPDLLEEHHYHEVPVARLRGEAVSSVRGRLEDGTCHVGHPVCSARD